MLLSIRIEYKILSVQQILGSTDTNSSPYFFQQNSIIIYTKHLIMKKTVALILSLFLFSAPAVYAQVLLKGTVRDEKGPLQGVTVFAKHTGRGTQTDVYGNFSIQASSGDTLAFSYSGYVPQETVVDGRLTYKITMGTEARALDEVVVIGYGTKKKQFLTGAVSTVGSEVFQSRPVTNALAALQGEVAGATIQRYSGQPGSEDFNLNVRGPSSKNGAASPLVLIDGIEGNLYLLNPSDIESISVLKDAQASIYGARAAGGVMLVTTKRGKRKAADHIQ